MNNWKETTKNCPSKRGNNCITGKECKKENCFLDIYKKYKKGANRWMNVMVTKHAIEKYATIMKIVMNADAEEKIVNAINEIYKKSIKEKMTPGLVKRMIDNDFKEAEYRRYGKWRLVICNNTIVTIEQDKFDFCGMGYIPKKKRKR